RAAVGAPTAGVHGLKKALESEPPPVAPSTIKTRLPASTSGNVTLTPAGPLPTTMQSASNEVVVMCSVGRGGAGKAPPWLRGRLDRRESRYLSAPQTARACFPPP